MKERRLKVLHYIYKFTNKTNGKAYIGQTNNIENRKRGHKSDSFNSKSEGYNLPFHAAIRKYGWDNFNFEVLEEIDDAVYDFNYVDERERFYIAYYHSLKDEQGYNITLGGQGNPRPKLTFEECASLSKLFTLEEIQDIQNSLIEGYEFFEIQERYPQLSDSFISNINTGFNFNRPELNYPLLKEHSHFSRKEKEMIKADIIAGMPYSQISKKYNITIGYISRINNGTKWHLDGCSYPLCPKSCNDDSWIEDVEFDLIFGVDTHLQLAQKYGKAKSTITALNVGRNRKKDYFIYPLRSNQPKNQEIWKSLF